MKTKLRFAPSPTGNLHVGNARTALVNYLFCKSISGEMMLRIDDTDEERSSKEYEESIKSDLNWLGIYWETTDRQSTRIKNYKDALKKLFENGRAYRCYETQEELSLKRKAQLMSGKPPVYDRQGLSLEENDHLRYEHDGKLPHWRFKLLDEEVTWTDLIRGHCTYDMNALSDPVIMREDGRPIYTLASVVDDIDHKISHIIRGEDHVTNSAAQIQLFNALGYEAPNLGHLSLISGADGEGLSKRLGSLSLGDLKREGLESNALSSLLARLGTSDPIVFFKDIGDLIESFDLNKFSRNTAKFDINDLYLMNKKSIQSMNYEEASKRFNLIGLDEPGEEFWNTVSGNLNNFIETKIWWEVVFGEIDPLIDNQDLIQVATDTFPNESIDNDTWSKWCKKISNQSEFKGKKLFISLRKTLTGYDYGPELSKLLPLIGKEKILSRLSGNKS